MPSAWQRVSRLTAERIAGRAIARRMAPQIRMTCKLNVEAFIRNRSLGKYGVN